MFILVDMSFGVLRISPPLLFSLEKKSAFFSNTRFDYSLRDKRNIFFVDIDFNVSIFVSMVHENINTIYEIDTFIEIKERNSLWIYFVFGTPPIKTPLECITAFEFKRLDDITTHKCESPVETITAIAHPVAK